jgi:hypothetical protein
MIVNQTWGRTSCRTASFDRFDAAAGVALVPPGNSLTILNKRPNLISLTQFHRHMTLVGSSVGWTARQPTSLS